MKKRARKVEGSFNAYGSEGPTVKWNDLLVVAVPKTWEVLAHGPQSIFPDPADHTNPHRHWRKTLTVTAIDEIGRLWVVASAHTVAGSHVERDGGGQIIESHKIPGDSVDKKENFKALCIKGVVNTCRRLLAEHEPRAPAASRGRGGIIAGGDWNIRTRWLDRANNADRAVTGALDWAGFKVEAETPLPEGIGCSRSKTPLSQ